MRINPQHAFFDSLSCAVNSISISMKQTAKNCTFFDPNVPVKQISHATATLPLVTPDGKEFRL